VARVPVNNSLTVQSIYDVYEDGRESFRPHLGASLIGRECERELWYTFRWCAVPFHTGRLLRLFETGQLEEYRFVENLRSVGIEVHDEDEAAGQQYGFKDMGGHFAGSIDGAALGILEAPKTWHLLEFKTYNDKRFELLKKNGVQITSPEHHAQMVIYMDYLGFARAFYLAVNKNTDELYSERIKNDPVLAGLLKQKAERIIVASQPLSRISKDPEWWKCKYCDFSAICHEGSPAEINCRTCLESSPDDGCWICKKYNQKLSNKEQLRGCSDHRFIQELSGTTE
jgi:hypothetical protein